MIKVYFGPLRHSPAPELPLNERVLWVMDFDLLRGFDRDFWTSNPLHLDLFDQSRIYLWDDDRWWPLSTVAEMLWPDLEERPELLALSNGRLALAAYFLIELAEAEREARLRAAKRDLTKH